MADRKSILKLGAVGLLLTVFAGCFNDPRNTSVHFGDVSVGHQLIDLQTALERGAISDEEHQQLKQAIMALAAGCESDG
jgi:hypothetical protein